ncbi:hypothetical protein T06_3467 [Trichinella sp. T6]|nr:hypothetical protein T06_3467 [Trichinella sp. T6]
MGGVDVMDKVLSSYRPKFRSRKWWWNLFSHALNMAVVAAWKLHVELHTATNDRLSHLQFRREITIHLLHARPFDDVQFAKETAEMNVFSAEKGYTEIVFRLITA